MPFLLATTAGDHNAVGSFLDTPIHDFLSVSALAAGWMTVIWITCAAITITGYLIGAVAVFGVRALVNTCARYVRRRRGVEYAQLVPVDADGTHTTVTNLDHYRQRRPHHRFDGLQSDDPLRPRFDDDPA